MSRPSAWRYVRWLQLQGKPIPRERRQFRPRDAEIAAEHRMREWAVAHLLEADPVPGQPHDTQLGGLIGLTTLAKRGKMARFYGRTSEIRSEPGATVVWATLDCGLLPTWRLAKALGRASKCGIRQMRNPDLKQCGYLEASAVEFDERDGRALARLKMRVTDPAARAKLAHRVYSGALLTLDGDEVADLSLVDTNQGFVDLEKAAGAVLAKIYDGAARVQKKARRMAAKISRETGVSYERALVAVQSVRKTSAPAAPQLPASALAAVDAVMETAAVLKNGGNGDMMAAKAAYDRARQAYGLEMVKMARRPAATGDAGLIRFLRGGRP